MKLRLAFLGSSAGSTLTALLPVLKTLPAEPLLGVSDRLNCGFVEKMTQAELPCHILPAAKRKRNDYDRALNALLDTYQPHLILLIGFMRVLSKVFTDFWAERCLNVHPSLLPKYAGLMDLQVHQAVLDAQETESGCTIHRVAEKVDGGEIIVQKSCQVYDSDDALSLKRRVQKLEVEAWEEALKGFCNGRFCL